MREPPNVIDVWLLGSTDSYVDNAVRLFGKRPSTPYGFFLPEHQALFMNIATGGGTLVHEVVHPFIAASFPAVPAWFNEGLASLYEAVREEHGQLWGLPNWRLAGLKRAIRAGKLPSFAAMTSDSDARFYASSTGYAQARYLCLYLQEKGLLHRYYDGFSRGRRRRPDRLQDAGPRPRRPGHGALREAVAGLGAGARGGLSGAPATLARHARRKNLNGRSTAIGPAARARERPLAHHALRAVHDREIDGRVATTRSHRSLRQARWSSAAAAVSATTCGGVICLARATSTRQSADLRELVGDLPVEDALIDARRAARRGATSIVDAARVIDFSFGDTGVCRRSRSRSSAWRGRDRDPPGLVAATAPSISRIGDSESDGRRRAATASGAAGSSALAPCRAAPSAARRLRPLRLLTPRRPASKHRQRGWQERQPPPRPSRHSHR